MKLGAPDNGGLFDWVTDFENPVVQQAVSRRAPRPPRPRRMRALVAGGSGGVIVTTLLAALLRPFEGETALPQAGPTGSIPSPAPSQTTAAPLDPAEAESRLPASCADLYGDDMVATLQQEGLELNETWTGAREVPAGTSDPLLLGMLAGQVSRDCYWLDSGDGSRSAVLTTVMALDAERAHRVVTRLAELGFAQQPVHGGTRYFVEHQVDGETVGESHFVRDGLWLATNWYGFGPWGYTAHMAENVFA